jgi:hypothetical protein
VKPVDAFRALFGEISSSQKTQNLKMKDREESSSSSSSMTTKKTNGIINNGEHEPRDINIRSFSSVPSSPRNASSKYDFVKVKVWLGDNADHYYVLSRFLVCRMLTVTKIPNHEAIKISLELKKLLIDNSLLDVYAHFVLLLLIDSIYITLILFVT